MAHKTVSSGCAFFIMNARKKPAKLHSVELNDISNTGFVFLSSIVFPSSVVHVPPKQPVRRHYVVLTGTIPPSPNYQSYIKYEGDQSVPPIYRSHA